MPEAGGYLFSNVGFSAKETPYLSFQKDETFSDLMPLGRTLTLRFNMQQRYCIGWGNMATHERLVCPDHNRIESKYEQCAACQNRTGFNPAFYYAASVSKQQTAHNQKPHILYLAHFGKGVIKVGISYAARGNSRLLEQGARSALILGVFPTALVAREHEARIAALPGIAETVQLRKKIALLAGIYDEKAGATELLAARKNAEATLGVKFDESKVMALDSLYFPTKRPDLTESHNATDQSMLSGKAVGMLGSLLFCTQQETLFFLPLKKYIGYEVELSYDETAMTLPVRQTSLFNSI